MRPFALAAAALLSLGSLGALTPAQAADPAPAPKRGLFLTVTGAQNTWIRGVLLRCEPGPSGPHPQAAEACEAIARAKGNFDALPDDPHACTKEYEPVSVKVTGSYKGRPVGWRKTYPNACALDADTGHVFRF
ncbi:SSI family serine proteinase inhibitor [Streptomyces sp. NPDC018029]|uniref:SSI family serine proteinase inhibitor n=1 Tax=Streptomyces sp. NPDC018029 TaxID=3365032 RepID=UPI0037A1E6D5